MRRTVSLLAALLVGVTAQATAQADARVQVTVDTLTHEPRVQVTGLLQQTGWLEALNDAFPIHLEWRIELWRDRTIFDRNEKQLEFDVVIRRDALLGQYLFTIFRPGLPAVDYPPYTELGSFSSWLEQTIRITGFGPDSPGNYYYSVSLRVSEVDGDEFTEMRRFMGSGNGGGLLGSIRSGIIGLVGVQSQSFSARTPRFQRP